MHVELKIKRAHLKLQATKQIKSHPALPVLCMNMFNSEIHN